MAELTPVLLTLPSLTPALALEILPHGLTFHRFFIQADGRTHDVLVGPEPPEGHLTKKYTNTIIGRYANRIPVGTHQLERNGVKGEFTAQANENPRVSLHGGPVGFDFVNWKLLDENNPPILFSSKELAHLPESTTATSHAIFRLVSPDGDQGYPGELTAEVLVALVEPAPQERQTGEANLGSLIYVYRAKVDKGVTPVNITQHWGFNLDASLREGIDVGEHSLTIKADKVVKLDKDSLHSGEYLTAAEAPHHAHSAKKISKGYPEKGYDDFYVFEQRPVLQTTRVPLSTLPDLDLIGDLLAPSTKGNTSDPLVELISEKSGLSLSFDSNQSGVMFYSNTLADPTTGSRKKIHGGSGTADAGDGYTPGSGAFLEFHGILAAFLDPDNKDKEDTLLTSDELYHNYVRCDVKLKEATR
ncbi:galactose mutarotase-like domain-containing protein [Mycena floridula]|nr:galactose mutarotase-like domain-containing protein [Mycena floridula]